MFYEEIMNITFQLYKKCVSFYSLAVPLVSNDFALWPSALSAILRSPSALQRPLSRRGREGPYGAKRRPYPAAAGLTLSLFTPLWAEGLLRWGEASAIPRSCSAVSPVGAYQRPKADEPALPFRAAAGLTSA
jgi:hypothetical protein